MAEQVRIWYRGAKYQLGKGPGGYQMWMAGGSLAAPVAQWPETADGWAAAWSRFTAEEEPGSIVHMPESATAVAVASPALPAGLLAAGVVAGAASLAPSYFSAESLAHQPGELVPHVMYLVAWAASGLLLVAGGLPRRVGALLGLGVSSATAGYFWIDLATGVENHHVGLGLYLGLTGWLACAAGSVLAVRLPAPDAPRRPRAAERGALAVLALAVLGAVGAAVAFAPSWDSYRLRTPTGASQTVLEGYAFSGPALLIAGNVVVMVVFVATAVAAASWRPLRLGAALLAGAVIPMIAQALSGRITIGAAVSPAQFGIGAQQARLAGLTITPGLTAPFWIYCMFLVVLTVTCVWMIAPAVEDPGSLASGPAGPGQAGQAPADWTRPAARQAGWSPSGDASAPPVTQPSSAASSATPGESVTSAADGAPPT